MNRTKYGNIAIGQEGSYARMEADLKFLEEKLRLLEIAADELRDCFVPNREDHQAVILYNTAKAYRG